jgi:acetylornithine/succinyldiaminopimelate/putrescine aminotransferase
MEEKIIDSVNAKEELFRSLLVHKKIRLVRSFGLWMSIESDSFEMNKKIIDVCIGLGVLTDWFLFASQGLRISPPLIISEEQIKKACKIILQACDNL